MGLWTILEKKKNHLSSTLNSNTGNRIAKQRQEKMLYNTISVHFSYIKIIFKKYIYIFYSKNEAFVIA